MYVGISIYNRVSNLLFLSDLFFSLSVLSKTRANPAEPRPTPPIVPPTSECPTTMTTKICGDVE